jgi:uncharacterized protein (TIGR02328 family)
MRLWHQSIIKNLPSKKDFKGCSNQLGGQHTEIRMILALLKKNKLNHSTVNYVKNYPVYFLKTYGLLVIDEMLKRKFNVSKKIIKEYVSDPKAKHLFKKVKKEKNIIYPEHNIDYYDECIKNLLNKKITFYRGGKCEQTKIQGL